MKKYTKEEIYKMDAIEVYKMVLKGDVIKKFPDGFWNKAEAKENATKCTIYLIENILQYNEIQLKQNNSQALFNKNKLSGMLQICFNGSPYEAINTAYPNKFKQWEFKMVPRDYWKSEENKIKAIKWLIEEKLKLSESEVKSKLSIKLFEENGLSGMLINYFNESPFKAINLAYPNKYKEWEFNYTPMGYWEDKNNGIKATKWLIEEKLKLNDEQLKERLSQRLFKENGLSGMIQKTFNSSPYEAINSTYPGKFKEWEFKFVSKGYWDKDNNGIKATKWLIEEKLKLSDKEIKEQLSYILFFNNGLSGMLQNCFNGSPYKAINTAYPNKFKEWEFKSVPMKYWLDKENIIKATKWLVEEKLKLNDEELKEQLSSKLFSDNGLRGMLHKCFNNSPYEAINTAYPNKFKKSDFKCYFNNNI